VHEVRTSVNDYGTIENHLVTYTMPSTGGMGTGVVYGAGAAVILLALLGLVLMNRKRGRGTGI
jgi:LPXTG-motif cell wall-anchored protein